jgi:hypothetical protein
MEISKMQPDGEKYREIEWMRQGRVRVTQSILSMAEDPEFVRLAAEAGCIGLFAGLETLSGKNLDAVYKFGQNCDKEDLPELIEGEWI